MRPERAPAILSLLFLLALACDASEPVPLPSESAGCVDEQASTGSESGTETGALDTGTGTEAHGYMADLCCACEQEECMPWEDGPEACDAYGAAIGSAMVWCTNTDVTSCLSQCP